LAHFYALDLQASANQKRGDDFHQDNFPGNNLVELAAGQHQLLGIPFKVGEGVLQLGSQVLKQLPEKIEINIGRKFTKIHVLHATAYGRDEGQITIGSYNLHYEDGTTQTIPIVNGKDIWGWWKQPGDPDPTRAKTGWEGSNNYVKKIGAELRLFVATWENPRPGTTVDRIDFVSAMTKAAPFCVAMTVAESLKPRAPAKPLTAAELERLWTNLVIIGTPACDAVETLAGTPAQAISFLGPRISAAGPTADVKSIAALITKLDDDNFFEREKATNELRKLGLEALPQLRRTMDETKSAEVRVRTQELLGKLNNLGLTPDHRRLQAVLHVFTLIASDEARKVLDEVAGGKAGAWLAAEAESSLKNMQKK
jgi:hypothetical protein